MESASGIGLASGTAERVRFVARKSPRIPGKIVCCLKWTQRRSWREQCRGSFFFRSGWCVRCLHLCCIVCECQSETEEEQKTVGIWRERERTRRTSCVAAAALRGVKHGAASVSVVRRRFVLLLLLLLIFVCECGLACARGRRGQCV